MKAFVITIDTESDNQWDYQKAQTTENAKYIHRFQKLCESFGFTPTYLVDYSMGNDPILLRSLFNALHTGHCEVGMHLHAWNTSPIDMIDKETKGRPYLIEYPVEIMEKKIDTITNLLEDKFEVKMVSHRAGRWAINSTYLKILENKGYLIDCSVTPGVNWNKQIGHSIYGNDYTNEVHYIHRIPGCKNLIEVPMTIEKLRINNIDLKRGIKPFIKSSVHLVVGKNIWLRPSTNSLKEINLLLETQSKKNSTYLEFMMHSSEFMPGGSPYYKTQSDIDNLYETLKKIFTTIKTLGYEGCTLQNLYSRFIQEE